MTKPTQKQRIFTTNNFAKHNHNYVNRPKTSKLPRTNTQNHLFSQRHNFQHPTTNSVNFIDYQEFHKTKVIIIHFFNKIRTIYNKTKINKKHLITHLTIFHQMMKIFITKIFIILYIQILQLQDLKIQPYHR